VVTPAYEQIEFAYSLPMLTCGEVRWIRTLLPVALTVLFGEAFQTPACSLDLRPVDVPSCHLAAYAPSRG